MTGTGFAGLVPARSRDGAPGIALPPCCALGPDPEPRCGAHQMDRAGRQGLLALRARWRGVCFYGFLVCKPTR